MTILLDMFKKKSITMLSLHDHEWMWKIERQEGKKYLMLMIIS